MIRLLSKVMAEKVINEFGEESLGDETKIEDMIRFAGFQEFYVQKLYEPFRVLLADGKDTLWPLLKLDEWIMGWLEYILSTMT
jgi:hypothetical protein